MPDLSRAVSKVMESGWYVLGNQVDEFEKDFAFFCQTDHCVSVASGSDAIEIALRALNVGSGDKVITVANAGAYSTTSILAVGAIPIYVDIDIENLQLSIEHLSDLVSDETRAIIITHLYGQTAPVDEVITLTSKFGIPIIEDCAQAHGAMYNGRRVGSLGVLGCFSFYPTKNLGALGDGGAIVSNDNELTNRLKMLRQYGWQDKYVITMKGGSNSRLDEIQATILRVKLPFLDSWNQRRFEICKKYIVGINNPLVTLPCITVGNFVGHLFVLRTLQRNQLREHLKKSGIISEVHYPIPDYRQPAFATSLSGFSLPATERACNEVLTLPCYPEMNDAEIQCVIDAVNQWSVK